MNKENIKIRNEAICKAINEGKTYEQIGQIFNLTRARISQIINKSLTKVALAFEIKAK